MDKQKILLKSILYGGLGFGGGAALKAYNDDYTYAPAIGAGVGATAGALAELIKQNKEDKDNDIHVQDKLKPGLYYMERGIWGNRTLLKGTNFHQNARHGYYVGVYDQKPEGIETQKLPNGQYVITFGAYPKPEGMSLGDLYIAINGKSKAGINSPNDFRAIKALMDPNLQRNSDFESTITNIHTGKKKTDKIVRKMYDIVRQNEDHSLGTYRIGLIPGIPANNCLTALGALTNTVKKDLNLKKLPEHFGALGGFDKKDLDQFGELEYNKHVKQSNYTSAKILDMAIKKASLRSLQ